MVTGSPQSPPQHCAHHLYFCFQFCLRGPSWVGCRSFFKLVQPETWREALPACSPTPTSLTCAVFPRDWQQGQSWASNPTACLVFNREAVQAPGGRCKALVRDYTQGFGTGPSAACHSIRCPLTPLRSL